VVCIDIVLATYDGERFLGAQLDSIIAQTHSNWHLIVRDDGSNDGSTAIIERYRQLLPNRLTVLDDDVGTLGHAQNFARMLDVSTAPYVAFCDQDDIWLPHKLQQSLDELRRLERRSGPGTPSLVFSDSVVVDADLRTIDDSYWAHSGLHPADALEFGRMLCDNVVAGHTTMINAALREVALPIPPCVVLVDWWVAVLASAIGASSFITAPTVNYRQHGNNAIGARRVPGPNWDTGLKFVRRLRAGPVARKRRYDQAEALSARVASTMNPDLLPPLEAFLELPRLGVIARVKQARHHGLLPRGFVRSCVFICSAPAWTPSDR